MNRFLQLAFLATAGCSSLAVHPDTAQDPDRVKPHRLALALAQEPENGCVINITPPSGNTVGILLAEVSFATVHAEQDQFSFQITPTTKHVKIGGIAVAQNDTVWIEVSKLTDPDSTKIIAKVDGQVASTYFKGPMATYDVFALAANVINSSKIRLLMHKTKGVQLDVVPQ